MYNWLTIKPAEKMLMKRYAAYETKMLIDSLCEIIKLVFIKINNFIGFHSRKKLVSHQWTLPLSTGGVPACGKILLTFKVVNKPEIYPNKMRLMQV